MRIVLPFPDKRLSPNARTHWATRHRETQKARRYAAYATFEEMSGGLREVRAAFAGKEPIKIRVTFYPPDRRKRDDDNMIASFKAYRDGIADAVAIDDSRFRAEYIFAEPRSPGQIEVELL